MREQEESLMRAQRIVESTIEEVSKCAESFTADIDAPAQS